MVKSGGDFSEEDRILRLFKISLLLENYSDIFSDFDPRPFSERALSDDFLLEARKAVRDKPAGGIQLNFLIPKSRRDLNHEKLIKKRLKEHFIRHYLILEKDRHNILRRGILFTVTGVLLTAVISFFFLPKAQGNIFMNFLVVLLEPASWFLFWEGLNQVIFESKRINPSLHFYKKMSNCDVQFMGV